MPVFLCSIQSYSTMKKTLFAISGLLLASISFTQAQDHRHVKPNPTNPNDTEYWEPSIPVVTPGAIPSDAIVLFDGKNLDKYELKDKEGSFFNVLNFQIDKSSGNAAGSNSMD